MTPRTPPPRPAVHHGRRIRREQRTVAAMFDIFCRAHHRPARKSTDHQLCDECETMLRYAHRRLDNCPFGDDKPVCSNCTIHCYSQRRREQVRAVMRYAGPRMLRHHPLLGLLHLWDMRRR